MPGENHLSGLETLEQSDAGFLELIEHAAKIVGVDLLRTAQSVQCQQIRTPTATIYTFREQWVLRWFIRRLAAVDSKQVNATNNDPLGVELLDWRPWALLLYLLRTVSSSVILEIFLERKFLPRFVNVCQRHLDSTYASELSWSKADPSCDRDERSPKRRRLSPTVGREVDMGQTIAVLLAICAHCAEFGGAGAVTTHEPSAALWTSVTERANFFSISLWLILRTLNGCERSELAACSASTILEVWDKQSFGSGGGGSPKSSDVVTFNKTCLTPCLELVAILEGVEYRDVPSCKKAMMAIKIVIAKTTVLHLRERFQKRYLKQWQTPKQNLTWDDIFPFLRDLHDQLQLSQGSTVIDHTDILYRIAVGLIPTYDVRRKQQEQEWVDALLVALSYVSCPRLSQLALSSEGAIETIDSVDERGTLDKYTTFTRLLSVAAASSCSPSTRITSYLAAAVLASPAFDNPWTAIASLFRINAEVFNTHTRVPTSDFALSQFVMRVEHTTVDRQDLELLKSGIVIPMLRAFASSRVLQDFVTIWRTQLQESMRVGRPKESAVIAAVNVWQDDDLFDELRKQSAISTATTVSKTLLDELCSGLQGLSTKVGSSLDTFATLAIATEVLGESEDLSGPGPSKLAAEVLQTVVAALQRRSDYQGQRWRLYKLVQAIQYHSNEGCLSEDFLTSNAMQVSLGEAGEGLQTSQWYQECLERFKVLVNESQKGNDAYQEALDSELRHLEGLLKTTIPSLGEESTRAASWDGRSMTIRTPVHLVCACLGTLLANPDALSAQRLLNETLLTLLASIRRRGLDPELSSSPLMALVEAVAKGSADKSEKTLSKFLGSLSDGESNSTPTHNLSAHVDTMRHFYGRLRPTYLKKIAERQFEHLKSAPSKDASLETAAESMAFLSWVASHTAVSYTRPERWSEWRLVADTLAKIKLGDRPFDFLAVSHALDDIIKELCRNAAGVDAEGDADLRLMVGYAAESLRSTRSSKSKVRLTKNMFALHTARLICLSEGRLQSLISDSEVAELKASLESLIASDLGVFASTKLNGESATKALVVLEMATALATTFVQKKEFLAVVNLLNQAVLGAMAANACDNAVLQKLYSLIAHKCTACMAVFRVSEILTGPLNGHKDESQGKIVPLAAEYSPEDNYFLWSDIVRLAAQSDVVVESLDSSEYAQCLEASTRSLSGSGRLAEQFLVGLILPKLTLKQLDEQQPLKNALNAVACLSGASSTLSVSFLLRLENANSAVTLHPQSVNQATIDRLLAQACLLISGSGSTEGTNVIHPHLIIDRVCTIVGTLLSRFRRRVADRHHLLLPVLQQMMRYFFYSPEVDRRARRTSVTGSDPQSLLRSLPAWLKATDSVMPPSTATNFSRLITSICNPTVSAAKSSRKGGKGSDLNDETKRVKALAGQHMQYLIMEYCRCSLDGDLDARVKEKMLPGMYSILDAMSRELLRSMNANMDPSSRAIFKILYDDWVRYGKWDKS